MRAFIASGLMAGLAIPGATVWAQMPSATCLLVEDTDAGTITIDLSGRPISDRPLYRLDFESPGLPEETDEFSEGEPGEFQFEFFLLFPPDLDRDGISDRLGNIMLTLKFGDPDAVTGPTFIYYNRDRTIPIDVAPGKLWYPSFGRSREKLEVLVSLDDFERQMQWGSGEDPASRITWIAKSVGTGLNDSELVGSGIIPLAPIWEAREKVRRALERLIDQRGTNGC
ncbi:MAG: hypothetical protein AAGK02_12505 [Pseudomonadota bacterium]